MPAFEEKLEDGIRFQLRRDLQFSEYPVDVGTQLVVKDPVKLEYFLFEAFESTLLDLLRVPLTVEELKRNADQLLRPGSMDVSELRRFLKRLLADNLLTTDRSGMGAWFNAKKRTEVHNARTQALLSILAIRFRGINPQPILNFLNPVTKYVFHPAFLIAATVLFFGFVIAAVLNIGLVVESEFLWQNLREPTTLLSIGCALIVVKVLHEFGHALACRSIGRECHEMGVLLLAFMPCLYCNVSDVWMEPNRSRRMLVSAAGIYVEMLIAMACFPLWVFSSAGPMQVFWFAMIAICTLNTLLINGNPLLRYDGYYLLSDGIGVPNLYSVAQEKLDRRFASLFSKDVEFTAPLSFLDFYGLFARLYRVLILILIIVAVYSFLERIELPNVGFAVSCVLLATTFGMSIIRTTQKLSRVDRRKTNLNRAWGVFALLVAGLLAIAFFPVTTKVNATGETSLQQEGIVYASDDGKIVWACRTGDNVKENQEIAKIENRSLQWSIEKQRQRIKELELSLRNHKLLQRQGADNAAEIELSETALTSARKIMAELNDQKNGLVILAAVDGILQPMPASVSNNNDELDLVRLTSTLFANNQDSFVKSGEPLALIANPEQQIVVLQVDEKQIRHVSVGQSVKMLIGQHSPKTIWGTVDEISMDNVHEQRSIAAHEAKSKEAIDVHVRLEFADQPFYQSRVHAVVLGPQVPVYRWLWRNVLENFQL